MVGSTVHNKRIRNLRTLLGKEVIVISGSDELGRGILEQTTDRHPQGYYVGGHQLIGGKAISVDRSVSPVYIRLETRYAFREGRGSQ